jgi:hypothetical protein
MAADTLSPEVIAATAAAKPVVQPRA